MKQKEKKLKQIAVAVICSAAMAAMLMSACTKQTKIEDGPTGLALSGSTKRIAGHIPGSSEEQKPRLGFQINCDIARPARNCMYGFGLCNCEMGPDVEEDGTRKRNIAASVNGNILHMLFTDQMPFPKEISIDTLFVVDEVLTLNPGISRGLGYNSITILPGKYRVVYDGLVPAVNLLVRKG